MNRAERRQQKKLAKKAAKQVRKGNAVAGPPPVDANTTLPMLQKAVQHQQLGQVAEAEALYKSVLEIDPHQHDANHLLGVIEHGRGNVAKAEELIKRALATYPDFPEALNNLGAILLPQGRLDEALGYLEKAVQLSPNYVDPLFYSALAYGDLGRKDEAVAAYEKVLALEPNHIQSLTNCADLYKQVGRTDEAVAMGEHLVQVDPNSFIGHNNLGTLYMELGRFEDAARSFSAAIAVDPKAGGALSNLGCALIELDRPDEAISMFKSAIALSPDNAPAYSSLSDVLIAQHEFDEARGFLAKALALKPDFGDAHVNMGILKLTIGEWEDGWKHYAWRRQGTEGSLHKRRYPRPLWDGNAFEGKTLFIYPEQGGGDYFQFVRFVKAAAEKGGQIILEIPREFEGIEFDVPQNVTSFYSSDRELFFDLHASVMELPGMLALNDESLFSDGPYISAPGETVADWAERLGAHDDIRVGIVWAGNPDHRNDKNRSIAAEIMAPLSEVSGVSLYSLQVGPSSDDVAKIGVGVTDLSPHLTSYVQTASALKHMDLVISVDTSVVHLAGGMGIPTWVLLPYVPDWRWMLDRDDTPWYPEARLYRQKAFSTWPEVIGRVKTDLQDFAKS